MQNPKSCAPVPHWEGGDDTEPLQKHICTYSQAQPDTCINICKHINEHKQRHNPDLAHNKKDAISPLTIGLDARQEFST